MCKYTSPIRLASALVLVALASCGGSKASEQADGGAPSSAPSDIGKACVPAQEKLDSFAGFGEEELSIETGSLSCATTLCLANHFRGRVSCPYGQDAQGKAPAGASPCVTPGDAKAVQGAVRAQCTGRKAADTVYCSCRCANAAGKTDDGATYCACPDGFVCEQLVTSLGGPQDTTSGAYCIKKGTQYVADAGCQTSCEPSTRPCP